MTTESKYTPGPWFAQGTVISPTPTGKRFAICEVYRDSVATAEANARLIASAPDLLAALQAIVAILDGRQPIDVPGAVMVANSAIAKATGGAQ